MTSTYQCPFQIESAWAEILKEEWRADYFGALVNFVREERASGEVYPPRNQVFNALNLTPFESVKVVIVGQDPYHGPGQAQGLSFSVPRGTPLPPSLRNIFKELESDCGIPPASHGCLESWAQQGVLMLNATLTVRRGQAKSHHGRGWERFTDAVIRKVFERSEPTAFLLWGASAQEKALAVMADLPSSPHLVLQSAHPSPFAAHRGFFGGGHFSKTNEFLASRGRDPINWALPA